MKQALIVIDVQESFRHRAYFRAEGLPEFLRNLQSVVDACQARDIPVVQVFHRERTQDAGDPFSAASGHVRAMPELRLQVAAVFHKHVHSAMFATTADGTTLEAWLRARGIDTLLITGIRTEQCCETTTRHASDLGFEVRYVADATLTLRLTRQDRELLQELVALKAAELVDTGLEATAASYVRGLIRHEARAKGLLTPGRQIQNHSQNHKKRASPEE